MSAGKLKAAACALGITLAVAGAAAPQQALAAAGTWRSASGRWWYAHTAGGYAKGWEKIGGSWYYFDGSGWMLSGWQKVGGSWYWLGSDGAMRTGWQKVGSAWYYFGDSGAMRTGWQKINYAWYYLDGSGKMLTGWQKTNGAWYYLIVTPTEDDLAVNHQTGALNMAPTRNINGTVYAFEDDGSWYGEPGWRQNDSNGLWVLIGADGTCKTGWQKVGSTWYYLDADLGYMYCDSVSTINGKLYAFDANGSWHSKQGWFSTKIDWQAVMNEDGTWHNPLAWYYVDANGTCASGWRSINGAWYYFRDSGQMVSSADGMPGVAKVNGKFYQFDSTGALYTHAQWVKDGSDRRTYWKYVNSDGTLLTGWQKINGKWYFFSDFLSRTDGDTLMGTFSGVRTINGVDYTFDENGALI